MRARDIVEDLKKVARPEKISTLSGYFKTGIGEYGEGDVFMGVTIPAQRNIAKMYVDIDLKEIDVLLKSKIHEHRMTGILILTYKDLDKKIYDFYMSHTKSINNWDLVDVSARDIVGCWLNDKNRDILRIIAQSDNIWERRIAMIATHYFIKKDDFDTVLDIASALLKDDHDLIQKAVGWSLRELGKRDCKLLVRFLESHTLSRTTLRYAVERFSESERQRLTAANNVRLDLE